MEGLEPHPSVHQRAQDPRERGKAASTAWRAATTCLANVLCPMRTRGWPTPSADVGVATSPSVVSWFSCVAVMACIPQVDRCDAASLVGNLSLLIHIMIFLLGSRHVSAKKRPAARNSASCGPIRLATACAHNGRLLLQISHMRRERQKHTRIVAE